MEIIALLLDVRVLFIIFSTIALTFVILVIVLWRKLNKLRVSYMNMLNGDTTLNVEKALIELQEKNAELKKEIGSLQQSLTNVSGQLKLKKSNLGLYRYNAFAESGHDLSFSMALVDDQMDGMVLSGIHNRDETYVFAKPLEKGLSTYTLSPEEKEAILRAGQRKS